MSRRAATWGLLAALLLWFGCYRTTLVFDPGRAEIFPAAEVTHTYMVGGVEMEGAIDVRQACPGGVARIDQYESALGVLVRALSAVVVSMRDAEIHCRAVPQEPR